MQLTISRKQFNILNGLAYWQAELVCSEERGGAEEGKIYKKKCGKNICDLFTEADKNGIPFWVQNSALDCGRDWRKYRITYFETLLKNKGIYVKEGVAI